VFARRKARGRRVSEIFHIIRYFVAPVGIMDGTITFAHHNTIFVNSLNFYSVYICSLSQLPIRITDGIIVSWYFI
jgi:hypothetical protein